MKTIMNTFNGHNKVLVEKINAAWNDERMHDNFAYILFAIAMRDKDEVEEKLDNGIVEVADAIDNADDILTYICDDDDLENILQFVGFERWY